MAGAAEVRAEYGGLAWRGVSDLVPMQSGEQSRDPRLRRLDACCANKAFCSRESKLRVFFLSARRRRMGVDLHFKVLWKNGC